MAAVVVSSARTLLKRVAIRGALEATRLISRAGVMPWARERGAIFTLHHVRPNRSEPFAPNAHLSVTPEFLAATIEGLLKDGYVPVALDSLPSRLADATCKERFFAFTLDDGYRNNAEFALPVFERFRVPFTVFVAGGLVDRTHTIWWETAEALIRKSDSFTFDYGHGLEVRPTRTTAQKHAAFAPLHRAISSERQDTAIAALNHEAIAHGIDPFAIVDELVMNEEELRALAAHPLATLGAHTISHANLIAVDAERLTYELEASAERVAAITGRRPASFAYPYGDARACGPREFAAARACGFSVAVTTQPGVLTAAAMAEPTSLRRISLNGYFQKPRYVDALASGIPFRVFKPAMT